jgi:hypothetical protein
MVIKVLMILFGWIKRLQRHDLCDDRILEVRLRGTLRLLGCGLLRFVFVEDN